jgi:BASS family bile acid:Na+ symporter
LGLGLTVDDFKRVAKEPLAFAVGATGQLVVLPLVALGLCLALDLSPELSVGLMILAFSPGGVSSNIMTKFARGDMALSISLTAVVSVLSILTLPILVALTLKGFMGSEAPDISITRLGLSVFGLVTVPVVLGMIIRRSRQSLAATLERVAGPLANGLFVVMVVGAVASEWGTLIDNLPSLGPAVIALNVVMLAVGYGSGQLFKLGRARSSTIAVEVGIQNATLGITIGSLLVPSAEGLAIFSLPSGVYGILMYVVSLPVIAWLRLGNIANQTASEDALDSQPD